MLDVVALNRAGRWPEAHERCLAALAEHRQRVRERTIGVGIDIDLLASDVAALVGMDGELVRTIARGTLLETPLGAIARALRACRTDWLRHPKWRGSI